MSNLNEESSISDIIAQMQEMLSAKHKVKTTLLKAYFEKLLESATSTGGFRFAVCNVYNEYDGQVFEEFLWTGFQGNGEGSSWSFRNLEPGDKKEVFENAITSIVEFLGSGPEENIKLLALSELQMLGIAFLEKKFARSHTISSAEETFNRSLEICEDAQSPNLICLALLASVTVPWEKIEFCSRDSHSRIVDSFVEHCPANMLCLNTIHSFKKTLSEEYCDSQFVSSKIDELVEKYIQSMDPDGDLGCFREAIARAINSSFVSDLDFASLTDLNEIAAEVLAHFDGSISLNGLTTLSDSAARALSEFRGNLSLDGLTTLSDTAAEALSQIDGNLSLKNINHLTDSAGHIKLLSKISTAPAN